MKTKRIGEKLVLLEHKTKMGLIRLGSKMGFRKYRELTEGLSRNMTNDFGTKRLIEDYCRPEEREVRRWLESGKGKSHLDVGAGSGRFTKMSLDLGASSVTAIDINTMCLERLSQIASERPGLTVRKMNARNMSEFQDGQFDRVMIFGNTLSGMYDEWHGGEQSYQPELIREMLRVAREEVCITLQTPASFRLLLQYYRMNGLEMYSYDPEKGIKRVKLRLPHAVVEYRSQHFTIEQIRELMKQSGVSEEQYEIRKVGETSWMIVIKKN